MRAYLVVLILGVVAVLVGTVLGGAGPLLDAIVSPPVIVRAALVGVSAVVALALLGRALAALTGGDATGRDVRMMIRGVRFAFLAVAALAAAAGWFVGHPLLLVVALVIAGVDVVETTFLLIVASLPERGEKDEGEDGDQPDRRADRPVPEAGDDNVLEMRRDHQAARPRPDLRLDMTVFPEGADDEWRASARGPLGE